jgi:hypothetical protein
MRLSMISRWVLLIFSALFPVVGVVVQPTCCAVGCSGSCRVVGTG